MYMNTTKFKTLVSKTTTFKTNPIRNGAMTKAYKKFVRKNPNAPTFEEFYNQKTNRFVPMYKFIDKRTKTNRFKAKFNFLTNNEGTITNKVSGNFGNQSWKTQLNTGTFNYRIFTIPDQLRKEGGFIDQTKLAQYIRIKLKLLNKEGQAFGGQNFIKGKHSIQIALLGDDDSISSPSVMRTTFLKDPTTVLNKIMNKLKQYYEDYEEGEDEIDTKDISKIVFTWIVDPPIAGQGARKLFGRSSATDTWFIPDTFSTVNCAWRSIYICRNKITDIESKKITDGAKQMKKRAKQAGYTFKKNEFLIDDFQTFVDYLDNSKKIGVERPRIIIYNNIFEKYRIFEPSKHKATCTYEIQLIKGHYKPLLRWKDIDLDKDEQVKKFEKEEINKLDESVIIANPKGRFKINPELGGVDIDDAKAKNKEILSKAPICPHCGCKGFLTATIKDNRPYWGCKNCKVQSSNTGKMVKSRIKWATEITTDVFVKNYKPHNNKIMAWDIEATSNLTHDGNFKSYMVGVSWMNGEKFEYVNFVGLDCLKQFCDWLANNLEKFHKYTLYAHNGGKFDLPLLFKESLMTHDKLKIDPRGFCELNGSYINMKVSNGEHFVEFKDSLKLLPQSLDKLCKEFNVKHKKLSETVSFNDININNWNTFPQLHKYLEHDCKGLLEVMTSFSKVVYDDTHVNITDCFTGATLAKKNYFQNFYDAKRTPIYTLNEKLDDYCRNSYYGGRVECFHSGKVKKKLYYLDYTSLYPSQMVKNLPFDKPIECNCQTTKKLLDDQSFFGFVRVMVKTIDCTQLPLHAYRDPKQKKLLFRHFKDFTEITIFSDEYYRGLKTKMYEYKVLDGVKFNKAKFLKKASIDSYKKKLKAGNEGNKALKQCYKIILNSLYGFWGLRVNNRTGVELLGKNDSWGTLLEQGKLIHLLEHENYTIAHIEKSLDVSTFNVAVASAITSYSRTYLYDLMTDVQSKGGNMYYCDTDSIICDLDISKHDDLMTRYGWDGKKDLSKMGLALGALKNEADELFEGKVEEMIKKEDGLISFDEAIFCGLKFYALKKGDKEICKCKGYSDKNEDGKKDKSLKLKYSDFEELLNGKVIQQEQSQFRNPVSNHLSETNFMGIQVCRVNKSFKKYYGKGDILESGKIVPYCC